MTSELKQSLDGFGITVSDPEADALETFLELLSRWNRVHNLTAITDRYGMVRRHLADSLALNRFLRGARIADVGSGAGLPGLPLAITQRERSFVLIESRHKRAAFIRHVQGVLGLENVEVAQERVEDLRGAAPFDTVLARAVAPLPELIRITEHLLGDRSLLLVPTGAGDYGQAVASPGGFRIRRLDVGESGLTTGALLAIQREPSGSASQR